MSQPSQGAPKARTAYEIICDALMSAGYIGLGQEPNGEQVRMNLRRLNDYCNYIQAKYGLKLFVQQDFALELQTGIGTYKLGVNGNVVMPKPRRCIEAYYSDFNQNRRPIILMSRNEWNTLSTTTNWGTVTAIWPDKQLTTLDIHVWLVPDASAASGRLHLILDRQIPNFSQVNDEMAFPPEWALTLMWGLADQISIGQPQAIIQLCKTNAQQYLSDLEDWDVEDASTYFQPDQRGQWTGRRFF
jgi:hypothetical protein